MNKAPVCIQDRDRLDVLTRKIIGGACTVANTLGSGFLEKVYENALVHELQKTGMTLEQQKGVRIFYDGIVVGEYAADLCVEQSVIVELKAVKALDQVHMAQCLNYLRATGLRVCLLVNFGAPKLEIKRLVNHF